MKHICKVYCKNLCWRQLCIKTWPVFVGVEKREVATKLGLKKWSILIASTPEVGDLYGQGHSVCLWVFLQTPATPRDQQPAPSYYMHHVIYRFLWSVKMSVTATNFFNEGCQERSKKFLIHHLNIKISFKFNTKLSKLISYFWDFTSQLMHVFFFHTTIPWSPLVSWVLIGG